MRRTTNECIEAAERAKRTLQAIANYIEMTVPHVDRDIEALRELTTVSTTNLTKRDWHLLELLTRSWEVGDAPFVADIAELVRDTP